MKQPHTLPDLDRLLTPPFVANIVLTRLLLLHRRQRLLEIALQRLRRAHQLCGLDPLHLLGAGHAGDQQHREIPPLRRQLLV